MRLRVFWTAANAVMLLAFGFSVVVQVNDPDPIGWIAIYGAAAVVCGIELKRRIRPWFPALLALLALIWAGTIAPRVFGKVRFRDMFAAFEMRSSGIEESREMYGLLIVAIWMVAVAVVGQRAKRAADSSLARGKP